MVDDNLAPTHNNDDEEENDGVLEEGEGGEGGEEGVNLIS